MAFLLSTFAHDLFSNTFPRYLAHPRIYPPPPIAVRNHRLQSLPIRHNGAQSPRVFPKVRRRKPHLRPRRQDEDMIGRRGNWEERACSVRVPAATILINCRTQMDAKTGWRSFPKV